MRYNLHTHTFRCRHAQGSDREYVEAAIKTGMKVLGFTDHCPQFFPTDYYSTFRMYPEDAADYTESVRALAKEYRDDIQILLGFETEYYPEIFGELLRLVRQLGCDYLIMGQHFIENEYDRPSFYGSSPSRDDIDRYIMQTLEGLRTDAFSYIAHPDIISYSPGDRDFYRMRMEYFCTALKEMDIPVEYNLLGMRNRKWYPNPVFWEAAAAVGCPTVIGYDAHSPEALRNEELYAQGVRELEGYGITPVDFSQITIRKP